MSNTSLLIVANPYCHATATVEARAAYVTVTASMALKSIIRRPKKDVILAELDGRLAQSDELQALKSELASLAGEPRIMLILDLSRVQAADSSGLGVLLYLDGLAQQAGSRLRVAGAGKRLLEVFKITHTDKVLTLDPDVASSLKHSPF